MTSSAAPVIAASMVEASESVSLEVLTDMSRLRSAVYIAASMRKYKDKSSAFTNPYTGV